MVSSSKKNENRSAPASLEWDEKKPPSWLRPHSLTQLPVTHRCRTLEITAKLRICVAGRILQTDVVIRLPPPNKQLWQTLYSYTQEALKIIHFNYNAVVVFLLSLYIFHAIMRWLISHYQIWFSKIFYRCWRINV